MANGLWKLEADFDIEAYLTDGTLKVGVNVNYILFEPLSNINPLSDRFFIFIFIYWRINTLNK